MADNNLGPDSNFIPKIYAGANNKSNNRSK